MAFIRDVCSQEDWASEPTEAFTLTGGAVKMSSGCSEPPAFPQRTRIALSAWAVRSNSPQDERSFNSFTNCSACDVSTEDATQDNAIRTAILLVDRMDGSPSFSILN